MAKQDNSENYTIYKIPDNFIEGGRIFNGMFKLRNFVEGVIIGGFFALIGASLPITSLNVRISVIVFMGAPWFFVCCIGVNGDSFMTFVSSAYKWFKQKSVMLYNNENHAIEAAPLDMMMSDELVRDKIITKVEEISDKRKQEVINKMNNAEIVFAKDSELERLKTPTQRAAEKLDKTAKNASKATGKKNQSAEVVDDIIDEDEMNSFALDVSDNGATDDANGDLTGIVTGDSRLIDTLF